MIEKNGVATLAFERKIFSPKIYISNQSVIYLEKEIPWCARAHSSAAQCAFFSGQTVQRPEDLFHNDETWIQLQWEPRGWS